MATEVMKSSSRGDFSARESARDSARDSIKQSVRDSARVSARGSARGSARLTEDFENNPPSARNEQTMVATARSTRSDAPDTFRSTMSTARVHTALAALTAEKNSLESRLLRIDSALESEKKKTATKFRGHK